MIAAAEIERIRITEFAGVSECVYLNHASSSPLPHRSANALRDYAHGRRQRHKQYKSLGEEFDLTPLRCILAEMLHCDFREIGFVPSTCDGLAAAANSIDWRPGDNVVVPQSDYPGLLYPWLNLARRGVEVRFCPTSSGYIDLDTLLERVNPATRAIALSHVQWTNGFKVDLGRLGRFCRDRGILSIVDAIQSLGAQELNLRTAQIDVLCAGSFKWLLGIPGVAVLFVSSNSVEQLHPDRPGRHSVTYVDGLEFTWQQDALRFLVGSVNEAALCVLQRSVELLVELGVEAIQAHTDSLLNRLETGLRDIGLTVTSFRQSEHRSSILSFTTGSLGTDQQLLRWLLDQNVIVCLRSAGIRVAPHFYNTPADIDTLLAALRQGLSR